MSQPDSGHWLAAGTDWQAPMSVFVRSTSCAPEVDFPVAFCCLQSLTAEPSPGRMAAQSSVLDAGGFETLRKNPDASAI